MPRNLFEKFLAGSLDSVEVVRQKGELSLELGNLRNALEMLLTIAVTDYEEPQRGIQQLKNRGIGLLSRYTEINSVFFKKFKRNERPFKEVDYYPNMVHIAWLMDSQESARELIAVLGDDGAKKWWGGNRLWREYGTALYSFYNNIPYSPPAMKLVGVEKHYGAYINWICDLSNHKDTSKSLSAVNDFFQKRQRDNRLNVKFFDGKPGDPALWDFRVVSIEKFIQSKKPA